MKKKSSLILPLLPDKFENLHKEEEKIRTDSILHINADTKLKDHLDIIHVSLIMIFEITISYENQCDDELTLQYLGIRLFNSIVSSIKLFLSGYYQNAATFVRDLLETGFLLDYFTIDYSMISIWKNSNNEERRKKFQPVKIRDTLDKRDGFTNRKREEIYKMICEYATHPSGSSFKLVTTKDLGKIGPFFDENYLKSVLEELAIRVPYFTLIYLSHFKSLPKSFLSIKVDFLDKFKSWAEKYRNTNLTNVNIEDLKEVIKLT